MKTIDFRDYGVIDTKEGHEAIQFELCSCGREEYKVVIPLAIIQTMTAKYIVDYKSIIDGVAKVVAQLVKTKTRLEKLINE